jgi:hypothetical protein
MIMFLLLTITTSSLGDPFELNLQHNPNLHTLSLFVTQITPENSEQNSSVVDTTSFLSRLSPGNQLRNIHIYICVVDYEPGQIDWGVWETMDSVLAGSRFPLLKMVHISLSSIDEDKHSTATEELLIHLPLLKACGMLNVHCLSYAKH